MYLNRHGHTSIFLSYVLAFATFSPSIRFDCYSNRLLDPLNAADNDSDIVNNDNDNCDDDD